MAVDAKFIQSTQEVQERVNGILMTPKTTKMWKVNAIFRVVEEWMLEHGRFYSIGKENGSGMAVWLDDETREVIEISSAAAGSPTCCSCLASNLRRMNLRISARTSGRSSVPRPRPTRFMP